MRLVSSSVDLNKALEVAVNETWGRTLQQLCNTTPTSRTENIVNHLAPSTKT